MKFKNYFKQAKVISENSPDAETKVGAILVHKRTGAVISSGYNGFVRGAPDYKLPKNRPDKYKYIIHAEQNLIYNCARHGIQTEDCYVVVTLSPCKQCMRAMFQAGIDTIYFKTKYKDFDEQMNMDDLQILLTKVGKYYRIELSASKE